MTGLNAKEINEKNDVRPGRNLVHAIVYGGGCLLLLSLLFHSAYQHIFLEWRGADYNYCWFVPIISLYMLWEKRKALALSPLFPSWGGLVPLSLGIAMYWLGELGGSSIPSTSPPGW